MREELKKLTNAERHTFKGRFERTGYKCFYKHGGTQVVQPTLLLCDIYCDNQKMTNHLWFNYCKSFVRLGQLNKSDWVVFNGRVDDYVKGHWFDRQVDYRITFPTKVHLESGRQTKPLPADKNALIGYIIEDNKAFYEDEDRHTEDDSFYVGVYEHWLDKQLEAKQKQIRKQGGDDD